MTDMLYKDASRPFRRRRKEGDHKFGLTLRRGYLQPMLWLCVVSAAHNVRAATPAPDEMTTMRQWVAAHLLSDAQFPFSFMWAGRPSAGLLPSWHQQHSQTTTPSGDKVYERVYADPATGLEVRVAVTEHADFPAVEWVLHFTNHGPDDTPILRDVLPLNAEFPHSEPGAGFRLRYALGSHERTDDFRPIETATYTPAETITLGSFGGRSSDGCLPFFNLACGERGVALGVGWTGQWTACFRHAENQAMNVRAGMEATHFKLHPGESVRSPAILLVFWDGADPQRGHNLLRATLRAHYTPRPNGQPLQAPIAMSAHGTIAFGETTEENMQDAIGRIAARDSGCDTWWIDTGWFDLIDNNWARSVGNFEPDKARFPRGMRPVADAAHQHGMKFLLWFEPERVMPDTWLYKHHRNWLIAPPPNLPYELAYMNYDGFHLLDLGNEQARKWLTQKTLDAIEEMQIDVYRQDFNMYPSYYWRAEESKDRLGIREMHYIAGLYEFWDALLAKCPGLLIDNCASGGRRIDFESLRRSVPLLRSDICFRSPLANQCMEYGLSQWIPFHGIGADGIDAYRFRSNLGATFVAAFNANQSDAAWAELARMIAQYKSFRQVYEGDFYPLTPYSLAPSATIAYQFDRADLGQGLVQAFRREETDDDVISVRLQGLPGDAIYEITDLDDDGSVRKRTGHQLTTDGLSVELPTQPAAALLLYRKLNPAASQPGARSPLREAP